MIYGFISHSDQASFDSTKMYAFVYCIPAIYSSVLMPSVIDDISIIYLCFCSLAVWMKLLSCCLYRKTNIDLKPSDQATQPYISLSMHTPYQYRGCIYNPFVSLFTNSINGRLSDSVCVFKKILVLNPATKHLWNQWKCVTLFAVTQSYINYIINYHTLPRYMMHLLSICVLAHK